MYMYLDMFVFMYIIFNIEIERIFFIDIKVLFV